MAKSRSQRNYSDVTLKMLFGFCGNQCSRPDCSNPIIEPATQFSPDRVVGHICHIYASSDAGPRGRSEMTDQERDQPDNLLLLCRHCHAIVDTQHETYPASALVDWKERHESRFRQNISSRLKDIGYAELEVAAKALLSQIPVNGSDLTNIRPESKIKKNGLGNQSETLLTMGAAKSQEVHEVIRNAAQLDPDFPNRLRTGFAQKYEEFRNRLEGDNLFLAMYDWASGDGSDQMRAASGLCILSHLFIVCDVFEK